MRIFPKIFKKNKKNQDASNIETFTISLKKINRRKNISNSFSNHKMKHSFNSLQIDRSQKLIPKKIAHFSCDLYPNLNQLKNKIIPICDELMDGNLEQIKPFPLISTKIIREISPMKHNYGLIFLAIHWSETLLLLEHKENWRKIYALVATIHLISILDQKQLLSKDELKVLINSLMTLYHQISSSILENSKEYLVNEYQMKEFCENLLDKFNQIGSGEYCNLICTSLLMNFVLNFSDKCSEKLCQYLCIIKKIRNEMKKSEYQ